MSADFFPVIGVAPLLGRGFTAEEDRLGGPKVVVLREALWRRKFAADPAVLGRTMTVDGTIYTHHRRAAERCRLARPPAISGLPITPFSNNLTGRNAATSRAFFASDGSKPNVAVAQARADLLAIGRRLQHDYPAEDTDTLPVVTPLLERLTSGYRGALWMLMGAVGLLLAIACANVASLQLARSLGRVQEFSIRAALGAGPRPAGAAGASGKPAAFPLGGALGVLLAFPGQVDTIKALCPATPRFLALAVDGPALAFTVGASVLTGLVFGLWPAFRAARTDLREALQAGGGKGSVGAVSQWGRQGMVTLQVALTVMLLAGAGLFARSLAGIAQFQFGFDPRNLLVFTLSVPDDTGAYTTVEKRIAFFDAVKARLAALPGVTAVGMNYSLPLRTQWSTYFDVEGRAPARPGTEPGMEMGVADADYFKALGVPLLRGRMFNAGDRPETGGKIIIDQRMAAAIFPNEDPIGKVLQTGRAASRAPGEKGSEIIGVVPTLGLYGIDEGPENYYQGYLAQSQAGFNEMSFVVRTAVAPHSLLDSARAAVAAVDPTVPVYAAATMEEVIASGHTTQTLYSTLLGFFAATALLLACPRAVWRRDPLGARTAA